MSPCVSRRLTDGYTQTLHPYTNTARQSDCSVYATLFMLYSVPKSEAFAHVHMIALSHCDYCLSYHDMKDIEFWDIEFCSITFICSCFFFTSKLRLHLSTSCYICYMYVIYICHLSQSFQNFSSLTVGLKAWEISHMERQHTVCCLLQGWKWTCIWGIDFLSVLWEGDGEVKAKSPAVDTHSHHSTGCSSIVRLVSLLWTWE